MDRVLLLVVFICTGVQGLRDVRVYIPMAVIRGDDAVLHCLYDLEGEQLYVVKWYWHTKEFFRYAPKESPPMKQFPTLAGLKVREEVSNGTTVVLEAVPRVVSGKYSCEVSADAPSFYTLIQAASLQVVDVPEQDPIITIDRKRYHHGDILKATCTSEHSLPAVNLTWYVNGLPANPKHVNNTREVIGSYYTAHSVLRMKVTKQSFEKHRLKIRCVAKLYDIYYKSNEKSVEAEKRRHQHHVPSTVETPNEWELIVQKPEVRYVYNSSAEKTRVVPAIVLTYSTIFIFLLR